MTRRLPIALAGVALAATLAACGDPTSIEASFVTVQDTLAAYAITGTPASVPVALDLFSLAIVRADGTAEFSIVFDIDAAGHAVLIPVQLISRGLGGAGVLKVTTPFETIRRAPDGDYVEDEPTAVADGEVVIIRATPTSCASSLKGPQLYAKLKVDSVNTTTRRVHFHTLVDPNCGFRALSTGLPKS